MPQLIRDLSLDGRLNGGKPTSQQQKMYAKAIYENIAESPDELAFKRGDILTIIEQDTDGIEGWWLCTLRGRQGICPGNRLKIIPSYDPGCYTPSPVSSPCPSIGSASFYHSTSFMMHSDLYENTSGLIHGQKHGKRRSWHIMPNKVVTPQKCGDVYLYDLLPTPNRNNSPYQNLSTMSDQDTYDTPKPAVQINYDSPRSWSRTPPRDNRLDDSYDIPRPSNLLSQHNITPSSSNSSLLTSDSLSLSSSNRSSLANMPDYDIPRRNPPSIRSLTPSAPAQMSQANSSFDIPLIQNQGPIITTKKELPLELSSALDTLAKLQNEATSTISRLLGFVSPSWRTKEKLEPILMDLKLAAVRLRTALHDLAEFGDGALGNAARADDKTLALKLRPLVKALRDADRLVHEASQSLDSQGWTVDALSRPENSQKQPGPPDSLDQLIACAQTLTEDVRQSASFIQGNSTLLFKRATPVTSPQDGANNNEWLEDYDYVSLESKESSAKKNAELRDALPQDLQTKFDDVVKNAETAAINNDKPGLNQNDTSLITYYATQTVTHMGYLTQAIDAFLQTVERNQPPKFFLAYGKFVVLSAHNLVNIGDIVHRNVSKMEIKKSVLQCADSLSEALKTCVAKTKKAAQNFPSVSAVQEMVDSVVDISHLAYALKVAMLQATQPVSNQ
ncbi:breast cancer anti-estrogen resistance protein 1 isoform X1 [Bradysia coprophila]|uniref:breast cancer anti-estrogen resistance protein 1 isoform X1 n=1 Tax=Bradysia coprophila TaxID=38358 RepID=UPI00187DA128|nr:breast cancer anti-estrogen resistance protein 1 isoform X1 [Bradysia coprophila]